MKATFKSTSGLLLPQIERHVMKTMKDSRPDDHSLHHMHPSDMAKVDWCGRHDYYRITDTPVGRVGKANPSFRMNNVFAEGHTIHAKYQDWLYEMGVLVGVWRCRACGHQWFDRSPAVCPACQVDRVSYKEYPLRHSLYMVEGHADGAVHLDTDAVLIEIKSIGIRTLAFEAPRLYQRYLNGESAEDIWFSISHPFATHMRQGQLYLWMAWPAYEKIVFIYESKFHQQTKEFVVSYNKSFILPVLETAKDVAQGVRAGIAPDRPIWATGPTDKVCKSCVYRSTCWQLEDKHGEVEATPRIQRSKLGKRRAALRSTAV
jgi:hypothetical protein